MSTGRPTKVFTCIVKCKTEEQDGWTITLDKAAFGGNYDVAIQGVAADLARSLTPGQSYALILERQNTKRKRDQTDYDGSKDWMYWWGLIGIDNGTVPSTLASPPQTNEPSVPSPDRQDLIMLQHASGVVAQALGDWLRNGDEGITPGTFSEYLKMIAQGATWFLKNHYQVGGYHAPTQTQTTPAAREEAPAIEEDTETPF